MKWFKFPSDKKVRLGLGAVMVLLVGGVCSYFSIHQYIRNVNHTAQQRYFLQKLDRVLSLVSEAESSVAGYVLTGNEMLLARYKNTYYFISRELSGASVCLEQADEKKQLQRLRYLISEKFTEYKRVTQIRKNRGAEAARKAYETGVGYDLSERVRSVAYVVQQSAAKQASLRAQDERSSAENAVNTVVIANVLAFLLTALTILILFRNIAARHRAEEKLKEATRKLQIWVEDLEQRNREFTILGETVDSLQSCVTIEEACRVISHSCQKLFDGIPGALYLINDSQHLVELATDWHGPLSGETVFSVEDCWALRRGRIYEVRDPKDQDACGHLSGVAFEEYMCIPLMGQGAALGFFHFRFRKGQWSDPLLGLGTLTEARRNLVVSLAEQASLALGNLRLRQTLHYQSMRDPLTNLFNRRHMEEVLDRELRRSSRSKKHLGIILLDIDHFKKFNDSHGHDAGDELLVELAHHIRRCIRDYDIPCRYGGEEFIILLPETTLEATHKRAEQIRKSTKHLQVQHQGKLLEPVTLSIGVAAYPMHGKTLESLFRAADTALYQAKAEGRDKVIIAAH